MSLSWIAEIGHIKLELPRSDGAIYVIKNIDKYGIPLKMQNFATYNNTKLYKEGNSIKATYGFSAWPNLIIRHMFYIKEMRIIIPSDLHKTHNIILNNLEEILYPNKLL
jgi:hypothetical protein